MAGIGHNGGPGMGGLGWRTHCWRQARARLLPTLPVEVVRLRVRRAAELGLDYRTYAGIRASTGHDLVAFLFSSNALRMMGPSPRLPQGRKAKLAALSVQTHGLASRPLSPEEMARLAPVLNATHPAPDHLGTFAQARASLRAALGPLAADTVLLVGDHALEAEWCAAGRLAGYLSADRFFPA